MLQAYLTGALGSAGGGRAKPSARTSARESGSEQNAIDDDPLPARLETDLPPLKASSSYLNSFKVLDTSASDRAAQLRLDLGRNGSSISRLTDSASALVRILNPGEARHVLRPLPARIAIERMNTEGMPGKEHDTPSRLRRPNSQLRARDPRAHDGDDLVGWIIIEHEPWTKYVLDRS